MTVHLVGLPHTSFDADRFSACAFTAKSVRFSRILRVIERDCVVYWGGDETPESAELVSCLSPTEQTHWFGEYDPRKLPVVEWNVNLVYWKVFHQRVIAAIRERIQPGDYVAVVGGAISQEVVDEFKNEYTCIEPGVGYEGICRDTFACFESYAWMHHRYGAYGINDGRAFDTVIPNSYEPTDFTLSESEGYALFVGRFISRKGPQVAVEIAERLGLPLKMAGAGAKTTDEGLFAEAEGFTIGGKDVEYVGVVNPEERKALMSRASLMITPTLYIGPFEGVHVESLLSGVPAIAPDYGVFTETLPREWRYSSLASAVTAGNQALRSRHLNSARIRSDAIARFSLDTAGKMYQKWFNQLDTLRNGGLGWYA